MTVSASTVLRRFGPMIYGPTALFSVGEGAIVPLIPVIASTLGADVAMAALISAALVVGVLCGNIPAGWAVARFGERTTMVGAATLGLLGAAGLALAPALPLFAVAVFVIGLSAAAFALARHAFLTTRMPLAFRARGLSLLGGTFRFGMFAGPFVAAGILSVVGNPRVAVWFYGVCLVATLLLVLLGPDPEARLAAEEAAAARPPRRMPSSDRPRTGTITTMWRYRDVLSRLGLAAAALSAVRSSRQIILPLWGVSIGLPPETIAVVVGISGAIDFAFFYASGQIMDRFGRLWAALPAMILMGSGFLALAFTHDAVGADVWFVALGAVLGLGNGLSSGILLTLGADLAPAREPATFLGSWRTLTDAGGAAAPLLVAGVTAVSSLAAGVGVVGVVGLLGAWGFVAWMPRFVPRRVRDVAPPPPTDRRPR